MKQYLLCVFVVEQYLAYILNEWSFLGKLVAHTTKQIGKSWWIRFLQVISFLMDINLGRQCVFLAHILMSIKSKKLGGSLFSWTPKKAQSVFRRTLVLVNKEAWAEKKVERKDSRKRRTKS